MIRTRQFEQDNEKVREFQNLESKAQLRITGPKELDVLMDQSVIEGCKLSPISYKLTAFLNNWIEDEWDATGVYSITFYYRQWKYDLLVPIDMTKQEGFGSHVAPANWAQEFGLDFNAIALDALAPFISKKVA